MRRIRFWYFKICYCEVVWDVFYRKWLFILYLNREDFYKCNFGIFFYLKGYFFSIIIKYRNYKLKYYKIYVLIMFKCSFVYISFMVWWSYLVFLGLVFFIYKMENWVRLYKNLVIFKFLFYYCVRILLKY